MAARLPSTAAAAASGGWANARGNHCRLWGRLKLDVTPTWRRSARAAAPLCVPAPSKRTRATQRRFHTHHSRRRRPQRGGRQSATGDTKRTHDPCHAQCTIASSRLQKTHLRSPARRCSARRRPPPFARRTAARACSLSASTRARHAAAWPAPAAGPRAQTPWRLAVSWPTRSSRLEGLRPRDSPSLPMEMHLAVRQRAGRAQALLG